MEDILQGTSQQLLNEDGTINNWDEDNDPRIIRDRYELFIHEDLLEVDLEEEFEDTEDSRWRFQKTHHNRSCRMEECHT